MSHCIKPCKGCPFRRDITPGALGGGVVETYIGQAFGPFVLPCHSASDYDPRTTTAADPQCAGAAIFRANVGVAGLMPKGIHSLPADPVAVFADAAEFIAHHTGADPYTVEAVLEHYTPQQMLAAELRRQGVRNLTPT
jgi:hypothetical protein